MPWQVSWHDDEERIVVVNAVNPWSWDDFKDFTQRMQAEVAHKSHKVHVIIQAEGDLKLPKPSLLTAEWVPPWMPIRDVFLNAPENRGLLVLVAAPLYVESILATVQSLLKGRVETDFVHFAKTFEEAVQLVADEGTG